MEQDIVEKRKNKLQTNIELFKTIKYYAFIKEETILKRRSTFNMRIFFTFFYVVSQFFNNRKKIKPSEVQKKNRNNKLIFFKTKTNFRIATIQKIFFRFIRIYDDC